MSRMMPANTQSILTSLPKVPSNSRRNDKKYRTYLTGLYESASREILFENSFLYIGKDTRPHIKLIEPLKTATLKSPTPALLVFGSQQMDEIRLDCIGLDVPKKLTPYFQKTHEEFLEAMDSFGQDDNIQQLKEFMISSYHLAQEKIAQPHDGKKCSQLAMELLG